MTCDALGIGADCRKFVFTAVVIFESLCALAAVPKQYYSVFQAITASDGLSSNIVNIVFKDRRGFVWFGTSGGLDRFDGIELVNIPYFQDFTVLSVCEADSDKLWIGTDRGLVLYNCRSEKTERTLLTENLMLVRDLYVLEDKRMLACTSQGLYLCEGEKTEKIIFETDALSLVNSLNKIIPAASKDAFWIASVDGLIYFNLITRKEQVFRVPAVSINNCSDLLLDGDKIYIGLKSNGIAVFDTLTKSFKSFPYAGNPYVTTLSDAGDGNMYVGTNGGGLLTVSKKNGAVVDAFTHTSTTGKISSNAVYCFLKDGNILWTGTYMGGVNYNPPKENILNTYSFDNKFDSRNHNIRSFHICSEGRKLIGTRNDGLFYISEYDSIVYNFSTDNSVLKSNIILSMFQLAENDFLIGTYGCGLYRFDSETLTLKSFNKEDVFNNSSFCAFALDNDSIVWMASSSGIIGYNPLLDSHIIYNDINSRLPANSIFSVFRDSRGRLWAGTMEGVCFFDSKTKRFITDVFPENIRALTKNVCHISEDHENNLWFCDNKEGVIKADAYLSKFEHLTEDGFLPGNTVTSIMETPDSAIWLASQKGLIRLKNNNMRSFSGYHGLPGNVFNTAVQWTDDSILWWGNESGLVYCDFTDTVINRHGCGLPAITSIIVSGEELHAGDNRMPFSPAYNTQIKIPSGSNLELRFAPLNYSPPKNNICDYYLEGYDRTWRTVTGDNRASYNDLPRGKYVFRVRFSSDINEIASLNVNVYQRIPALLWALLICIAFCAVCIAFYLRVLRKYKVAEMKLIAVEADKYSHSRLEDNEVNHLNLKLNKYMRTVKPFLNPEFKLQDLALAVGCTTVELSQMLNVFLKTNFTDYINQFRVEEFIALVRREGKNRFTLTSLSEQCGFSSKTSFFRSFRKLKGMTPAEFVCEMVD